MRRITYTLTALCLIPLFAGVLAIMVTLSTLKQPLNVSEKQIIMVNSGGSISSVARELEANKILPSSLLFRLYARLTQQTQIKAGEYQLTSLDTSLSLLKKLIDGDVVFYQLTLVEGWTFKQALDYIHTQIKLKVELGDDKALQAFLTGLALPNQHPEGWFFPDTYRYSSTNSDSDILQNAHQRMLETLDLEWANREADLPYESSYQALVMASIIEKETGVTYEREQIAGVFVRRLIKNMRLQTDPTVIYGLGEDFNGNLRRRHLSEATPYNTYMIWGLPPTPIALPGREAIYAALHPDNNNYLYFVAKGDGSHQFSETIEQHNQAVQTYQVQRRAEQYRSAPPSSSSSPSSTLSPVENAQ